MLKILSKTAICILLALLSYLLPLYIASPVPNRNPPYPKLQKRQPPTLYKRFMDIGGSFSHLGSFLKENKGYVMKMAGQSLITAGNHEIRAQGEKDRANPGTGMNDKMLSGLTGGKLGGPSDPNSKWGQTKDAGFKGYDFYSFNAADDVMVDDAIKDIAIIAKGGTEAISMGGVELSSGSKLPEKKKSDAVYDLHLKDKITGESTDKFEIIPDQVDAKIDLEKVISSN